MTLALALLLALSLAGNAWLVRILVQEARRKPYVYQYDGAIHIDGTPGARSRFIDAITKAQRERGYEGRA